MTDIFHYAGRFRSLFGAPIIALLLIVIDDTVTALSLPEMAVLAVVASIVIHELLPTAGDRFRDGDRS